MRPQPRKAVERAPIPNSGKCDREQARAEQHKAGCGDREKSVGYEVMVAHGTYTCRSGSTGWLPEYDYRHDAQSKGLRGVAKLGIRLMLRGNSDAGCRRRKRCR